MHIFLERRQPRKLNVFRVSLRNCLFFMFFFLSPSPFSCRVSLLVEHPKWQKKNLFILSRCSRHHHHHHHHPTRAACERSSRANLACCVKIPVNPSARLTNPRWARSCCVAGSYLYDSEYPLIGRSPIDRTVPRRIAADHKSVGQQRRSRADAKFPFIEEESVLIIDFPSVSFEELFG